MEKLILFTTADMARATDFRSGEIKFGEKMLTVPKGVSPEKYISECDAPYVLFGIPEDIGVRANAGRRGAASAWEHAIKSIANIQHNKFCKGSRILVLGTVDVAAEMTEAEGLDFNVLDQRTKLSQLVERIDKEVAHIISMIVRAGKKPIIIGGGHNNAYGNIKGTALAKGKPVNAVNFDAHSDFRILEGRHSGNGFSYAFEEGFLKKYFIFGLHESYTSKSVLDVIKRTDERVRYNTYDEVCIRSEKKFKAELQEALDFVSTECFGIEIDLDSVPDVASSAMTMSGYSVAETRAFINHMGSHENAAYLHICEGAPDLAEDKNKHLVGKLIGYMVTDFIKANYKRS